MFSSFGLQQLVNFPTRVAPNGRLSCLDLLATNRPLSVRSVDDAAPLAASDHLQVITTLAYNIATANTSYNCSQTPTPPRHAFRKVTPSTWSIINSALFACDWHLLFTSTTVDEAVEKFTTVLDDVLSFYVPQYGARPATPKHGSHQPRQSSRNPKIPWLDKDLQGAIKLKYDYYSLSKKYSTYANISLYKKQRNLVKSLSRSKYRAYLRSLTTTLSHPSSRPNLYTFVRTQRTTSTRQDIPPLLASNGSMVTDPKSIANTLNTQFTSAGIPDDHSSPIPPLQRSATVSSDLRSIHTTTSSVRSYLKRLKSNKSPGPDALPNEVLKVLAPSLAYPLCLIFNLSYSSGVFPDRWKIAKVTPIYKCKGSRSQASNYRPISLLCSLSKVCEKVFYDQLYCHISPCLSPSQSGFRRNDSTSDQLARLVQDIATLRDARHHIALCFFDLAKAFDTVWHRGLLAKLHIVFGVSGPALSWLESYLSSRSQFVSALSINSDPLPVSSGVPQGSILGPLLFVAYVNDLPSIDPGVSLFADDTTLLSASSSSAALVPRVSAQICSVLRWMQTWRLRPNLTKTEIMFLPPISSMSLLHHPDFPEPIKVVSNHKHLGIMLDDRLSWSFHIHALCSRSSSALGVIRPHCFHLPFKCKILFYKLYILPLFMYAAVSWCGLSSVLAEHLEIHHRKLLRILFSLPPLYPSASLYVLANACPLSTHRQKLICTFAHKFKLALHPPHLNVYNWFRITDGSQTRCSVALPLAKTSSLVRSPLFVAYSAWLALPATTRSASTLDTFKSAH